MPKRMSGTPLGHMMDGKIYLFGNTVDYNKVVTAVFNTKTQTWETEVTKPHVELRHVLHGPHDSPNSIVYDGSKEWMQKFYKWKKLCVIDDVFYDYNRLQHTLEAYDTNHGCWREVKGLETFLPGKNTPVWWPRVVNYGGKLLFLFQKRTCRRAELWCAEIALERRQDGEIWGRVEWSDLVIVGDFCLKESLVAMF